MFREAGCKSEGVKKSTFRSSTSYIGNKIMKNKIITIPNTITILKLPIAVLIMLSQTLWIRYVLLIISILSDFFDGYVARKLNQTSELGAILDPLTDRIFVIAIFLFFFLELNLPIYLAFLFFTRDIITGLFASVFIISGLNKKIEIKASNKGKLVTFLQFITLLFVIAKNADLTRIGIYLILLASIIAIADYFNYVKRSLKK
jgi:CDP-diacylglycerol--glycerol-3-phosphate 3-phosphatidyltransferase